MTNILSLDLGTKTGWAFTTADNKTISGVVDFQNTRFQGGGMRFLKFHRWLIKDVFLSKMDVVYFETVRSHAGTDAAHVYGGFLGILTAACEEFEIPYEGVSVQTIKKHITDKGNASKSDVIKAVKELGFNPKDDNEADALALLDYAQAQAELHKNITIKKTAS